MKKIIFIFTMIAITFSCKNSEECQPEQFDAAELVTLNGEFIYVADAAVLKGSNFIYGVTLDCMSEKLASQVSNVKKEDFDMVPVVVKGKVRKKAAGTEGWDEQLIITEIVKVSSTPSEADIKIDSKKE